MNFEDLEIKTCDYVTTLKGKRIKLTETMCSFKDTSIIVRRIYKESKKDILRELLEKRYEDVNEVYFILNAKLRELSDDTIRTTERNEK